MEARKDTSRKDTQKTKRCLTCGRNLHKALNSNYCSMLCEAADMPFPKNEAF